jgi:hypothetical protein
MCRILRENNIKIHEELKREKRVEKDIKEYGGENV